ncbi:serine protease inhibitor 3/4-like [Formica exsecta]|uniref:serine protease inhibitor 3/4-like n=1 Tax=Formica exsecta TaxID=72781 RepID=UPI001144E287|nr:serine protease inhibitor 3/4-like [Formica exsecta]
MYTALFAIIIANIVCAFDESMFYEDMSFSSLTNKNIFNNLSTAIVTYVELKDVFSLKKPLYIKQLTNSRNKVFSNMSLKILTVLLANGAGKGLTGNELMSFWNITDKISLNNKYLSEFTFLNNIKNIELHVENAIYVQKSVDLTADFSSICINILHCSISKVDFRDHIEVAETINSWVQKTTNNEILHVLSPVNIDKDTKIMLVNTAYLNIGLPNLKGEIVQRKFHVSPSESHFVPTIKFEKSTFSYFEIPHWNTKVIEILFLNNKITMFIFLPNKEMVPGNLYYLNKKFNFKEFKSIRDTYSCEQVMELYLPKFTIQYTQDMTHLFRWNGIITMFKDKADFTHLSKIPLKVSNIVQKVSVRINEEDSIIPEVVNRRGRKSVGLPQELVVDRPFMYVIETNGKIGFIGSVRKPDFLFMKDEL